MYSYNLGNGVLKLTLPGVNITNNQWHNITVFRRGNYAYLKVMYGGFISGSVGSHQLLDSTGIIYVGGIPDVFVGDHNTVIGDFSGKWMMWYHI